MESHTKGLRFGPTVQQGGVQTIQQAIYLIHDNPCGINQILLGKLGSTNLSALELIDYLNAILLDDFAQEVRLGVVQAVQNYGEEPTAANHLNYLKSLTDYARSCAQAMLGLPPVEGYIYHLSLYDPSGAMIWDSYTPNLFVYKTDGSGNLSYNEVELLVANPYGLGGTTQIFQINERPNLIPYLRVSGGSTPDLAKTVLASQFINSAMPQAENIISISSLLIDPANTRVYNKRQFGIGLRQIQVVDPSSGSLLSFKRGFGYYVNYLTRFTLNPQDAANRSLFEFMFIRLGLEQFDQ